MNVSSYVPTRKALSFFVLVGLLILFSLGVCISPVVRAAEAVPPGAFNKTSPADGATNQPSNPTLRWGVTDKDYFEYCFDTTNDNACSNWVSVGINQYATLSGLSPSTTYYWQVRAVNADGTTYANGSSTAYRSFTTYPAIPPAAFNKSTPANGSISSSTSPNLNWGSATGAASYEYCYDTSNDNACANWIPTGTIASASISGLTRGVTYYWQARANNEYGTTYANASETAYWSYSVSTDISWTGSTQGGQAMSFKVINAGTQWSTFKLKATFYSVPCGQSGSVEPTIAGPGGITSNQFSNSSAALLHFHGEFTSQYEASGTYQFTNYPVTLYTPDPCTHYLTQSGTWTATTPIPPPDAFGKTAPADGATYQPTSLTLGWGSSANAISYSYCIDTTDNYSCDTGWVFMSASTTVDLTGLTEHTTYYWQARANNSGGTTYADGSVWWSFTTALFADVPGDHWAKDWIERLYNAGITGGCGTAPLIYCPENPVTRAQMAIFLERGMNGSSFVPPTGTGLVFGDVPGTYWAVNWIEKLFADGITSGCGGGNYCPENPVTRAQMAIFLLRSKHGAAYNPPTASGSMFTDVPITYWAVNWIEQLATEGITGGCGTGLYCPDNPVTRAQMAVFLVRTFSLP